MPSNRSRPQLGTARQMEAERWSARWRTIRASPRRSAAFDELAAIARGRLPTALASLDDALAQWTRSLIMKVFISESTRTGPVWLTDDSPRTWQDYTLGGVGVSGDNPDAIYRAAKLDGGRRYEVIGRFPAEGRAAQIVMQVNAGDLVRPAGAMTPSANRARSSGMSRC